MSVWGSSPDDLHVVGGSLQGAVAMHFDGTGWSSAQVSRPTPRLNDVFGFGPDSAFAVGNAGAIQEWDGQAWHAHTSSVTEPLWGVWGSGRDDVWAVGGGGDTEGQQTILHYDGEAWAKVPVPQFEQTNVYGFFDVWGTAADDVYIVGQRGAVLHYDGSSWTPQKVGVEENLSSIWGTSKDSVVLVGGTNNAVIAKWDGTEWTSRALLPLPKLNGLWMDEPTTAHVVGENGTIARVNLETYEYTDLTQDDLSGTYDFAGIFGDQSGRLTAVGGNVIHLRGPYRGVARQGWHTLID